MSLARKVRRYQLFPDWRRSIIPNFIFYAVIVAVMAVGASFGFLLIGANTHDYPVYTVPLLPYRPIWTFLLGASIGSALAVALIALRLISDDLYEALTEG
jgi:hypothetical protein